METSLTQSNFVNFVKTVLSKLTAENFGIAALLYFGINIWIAGTCFKEHRAGAFMVYYLLLIMITYTICIICVNYTAPSSRFAALYKKVCTVVVIMSYIVAAIVAIKYISANVILIFVEFVATGFFLFLGYKVPNAIAVKTSKD